MTLEDGNRWYFEQEIERLQRAIISLSKDERMVQILEKNLGEIDPDAWRRQVQTAIFAVLEQNTVPRQSIDVPCPLCGAGRKPPRGFEKPENTPPYGTFVYPEGLERHLESCPIMQAADALAMNEWHRRQQTSRGFYLAAMGGRWIEREAPPEGSRKGRGAEPNRGALKVPKKEK